MCQNYQSRDRIGNADVALKCARASGIDWETSGVGRCAGLDGSGREEEGVGMLRESVVRTRALGVTYVFSHFYFASEFCSKESAYAIGWV